MVNTYTFVNHTINPLLYNMHYVELFLNSVSTLGPPRHNDVSFTSAQRLQIFVFCLGILVFNNILSFVMCIYVHCGFTRFIVQLFIIRAIVENELYGI